MMRSKIPIAIILLFAFVYLPLKSQEDSIAIKIDTSGYKWERFSVSLGGFLTTMNSDISLGSKQLGLGININLEDALGLSTTTFVVRSDIEYYFGKRQRSSLRLGYFGMFRNASKVLEAELEIGDAILPAGAEIRSKFDIQIFRGIYDYSFYQDERIKLGLSAGIYVLPIGFSVSSGNTTWEQFDIIAPLPLLGFRNAFFVTPKILLKQNLEVLYLKTSSFKGTISDLNLWVEYYPWKHFGFGLGYNAFNFNVAAYNENGLTNDFVGSVESGFSGLLIYGKYYF